MLKRLKISPVIILVIMFCASAVHAQVKRDDIWNKIEKIKVEKLINRLDLDESTASQFKDKYIEFGKTIRRLNQKRAFTYKLMAENLQSGEGLDTLFDQLLSIEDQITTARRNFAEDLKTILTTKQIVTMVLFERKFNAELKKLLQEYMKKKNMKNN